ncbi:MAG: UDP-N-acetyl-D-mannosamine dehydrogenase [Pseudomonadales bacterium]|nr:UDP-N-acetyl-D-mannosamine dehydrogenase [Pseudomonadales bacterium]
MKTVNEYQKICVMGLGYIGLPTASLLATKGFKVVGVDVSQKVVDTINQGEIHIVEPDLDILVKSAVHSGNLSASLEPCEADVFIIAVPTPFKDGGPEHISGKKPDLSYIESATKKISSYIKPDNLVILESTSPVGTTDEVVAEILKGAGHAVGENVYVSHCPERVLPGRILIELVENDRVVGGINDASTKVTVDFYQRFVRGSVLPTTAKTAEMVKLTENSSRDVQIAFANELSMICETENIDTWEVIELANRHPRVNILNPGPGVGGHCIAVDPWFIVDRSPEHSRLIRTAREVNDLKPEWVIERIKKYANKLKNPKIGCLGITFKADVDDLRESPALGIVNRLIQMGIGDISVCEPNIKALDGIELCGLDDLIMDSDILLLLVDHKEFRALSSKCLDEKIIVDTRGFLKK